MLVLDPAALLLLAVHGGPPPEIISLLPRLTVGEPRDRFSETQAGTAAEHVNRRPANENWPAITSPASPGAPSPSREVLRTLRLRIRQQGDVTGRIDEQRRSKL